MNEFNEGLLKPQLDPLFDEAIVLNEAGRPLTLGHEEAIKRNIETAGIKFPPTINVSGVK